MQRDSIDFGKENVSKLFIKMFVPTLLGMVCSSLVNITDGIFVGRGVGSDALAAVNLCAPLFMVATGLALMLGAGGSVVVAIHMARGSRKAANINMTQAMSTLLVLALVLAAVPLVFRRATFALLGATDLLAPLMADYMRWVAPSLALLAVVCAGMFFIRLDGDPTYAMLCEVVPTLVNIALDWLFIFPLGMGIEGAAVASLIAMAFGMLMIVWYFAFRRRTLGLYRPKFSRKALRLYARNVGYMSRAGFPSLLGELAMSCVILAGNLCFLHHLGEDGVAAWSVGSYSLPIIFMIGNAIAQSAQPILSFNHGSGQAGRVRQTYRLEVVWGVAGGLLLTALGMLLCRPLASMFLEPGTVAHAIAARGLPWFSAGFLFTTLNLVRIGYLQAVDLPVGACVVMLLRGLVFVVPLFVLLPRVVGEAGLWLAVPVAELLTLVAELALRRTAWCGGEMQKNQKK